MAKRLCQMLVVVALVAGCGKSVPVISSPTDGQQIVLDSNRPGTCFQVTLADVDYQNTTIEVRGAEQLGGELNCQPGNYSPAQCCQVGQQFGGGGGFSQSCVQGRPCPLVLIARRGDMLDVKTVNVIRQTGGTQPPPQPPR